MKRLFQPIDIASLVFFRLAFGILGFAHVIGDWTYYHLQKDAFNPDRFQFKYMPFEWLPTFHDPWMSLLIWFIAGCGLAVALGWRYRWTSWLFAFGFLYLFLLEKSYYLNHGYLFCWLSFIMPFLPAHRAWSVDVRRDPGLHRSTIPAWPVLLLCLLMGIVYFYGGLAKINSDWLRAVPLKQWMQAKRDYAVVGPVLAQPWVPWFMAYGGLLLDLSAPFLLFFRRTRPWIFGAIIAFHLFNFIAFQIGVFPWLSLSLSALYFSPSFPRGWWRWLTARSLLLHRLDAGWKTYLAENSRPAKPLWQEETRWRPALRLALVALILPHLVIPFRHYLIPGDVGWTEEGHRYSWRMMLRSKKGSGSFFVKDPATGEKHLVDLEDHLWDKQRRKLFTHPDMIWQFAQYLEAEYRQDFADPEVYARITVWFNDRPRALYIDPKQNLARESWSYWKHSDWILDPDWLTASR